MFSCEFCETAMKNVFTEHLWSLLLKQYCFPTTLHIIPRHMIMMSYLRLQLYFVFVREDIIHFTLSVIFHHNSSELRIEGIKTVSVHTSEFRNFISNLCFINCYRLLEIIEIKGKLRMKLVNDTHI